MDHLVDLLRTWKDRMLEAKGVEESGLTETTSMTDFDARVTITTLRIAVRPLSAAILVISINRIHLRGSRETTGRR